MTAATVRARLLGSALAGLGSLVFGATELRDLGRTITHRPCGGRADDDQYAASPAAAERARAVDGRRPIGHVVADSLGMANGRARRWRR